MNFEVVVGRQTVCNLCGGAIALEIAREACVWFFLPQLTQLGLRPEPMMSLTEAQSHGENRGASQHTSVAP